MTAGHIPRVSPFTTRLTPGETHRVLEAAVSELDELERPDKITAIDLVGGDGHDTVATTDGEIHIEPWTDFQSAIAELVKDLLRSRDAAANVEAVRSIIMDDGSRTAAVEYFQETEE